mmetsp:Transcript_20013/g.80151  ORF Transcript_20013/g.80151 Transcript_20013/m.80151 type:complete len:578 (-) Transcript_20013:1660-3393(-)
MMMLEPWAEKKHPYIGMTMRVMYKELMSLGIIALIFTLIEVAVHPSKTVVIAFEYAHIFLFFLAVMNIVAVGATTYTSLRISRRWKKFQNLTTFKYEKDKNEYEALSAKQHSHHNVFWESFFWHGCNLKKLYRFNYLHDEMTFHDLRIQFLHYMDLPPVFNFSKYLRHVKSTIFVELVEIAWYSWLMVLSIFVVDCIRRIFYTSLTYDLAMLIALPWCNFIMCFVIYRKVKHVYWEMTKHPGLYFDEGSVLASELDLEEKGLPLRFSFASTSIPDDRESEERPSARALARYSREEVRVSNEKGRKEFVSNLYSAESPAPLWKGVEYRNHNANDASKLTRATQVAVESDQEHNEIPADSEETKASVRSSVSDKASADGRDNKMSLDGRAGSVVSEDASNVNKTIHEHAIEVKMARAEDTGYPRWLTFFIPRLKRKASSAEKLFWFGSANFFAWLCQMTLLFSVILVTLNITDLIFDPPRSAEPYFIVALASGMITFILVQIILAFTMKKYTIVLNAAHLVEDELSAVLIEESLNNALVEDYDDDDDSEDESVHSEEEKKARKRSRLYFLGFMRQRLRI